MPFQVRRPKAGADEVYIQVKIPASMKEAIIQAAEKEGISFSSWVLVTLRRGLRKGRRLPEAPPAHAPKPTLEDQIRSAISGEKLLMPCGKVGSCEGMAQETEILGEFEFCRTCGIRVV